MVAKKGSQTSVLDDFFSKGVLAVAVIRARKNKVGEVTGYKVVVTLGRDERNRKVYVSTTIPSPGLTPKKEEKEVRRIAEEWEHEQREAYAASQSKLKDRSRKKRITVAEFIDEVWMEQHVKDGKHVPNTVAFYEYMSSDIKAYFGDKKLVDVSKGDILEYLRYLRNDAKTANGKKYSAATVKHHFNTIRNILEFAVYIEYRMDNPCKMLKKTDKPQNEDREIDFLEEENAIRFMACLDSEKEKAYWERRNDSYLMWKTMANIMIVTGLRRGELVGLQWGDLDKGRMMLSIRRNVTIDTSQKGDKSPKKKIHVGETKGKKIRRVPISTYLIGLLDELRQEREQDYKEVGKDGYIFCRFGDQKLPMYPTNPTRMVRKFIERHGLPDVSPHDLRHTAASLAIQSGANVKEIQKLLGHKDAATTLKFYAGISEKAQRETIDGIEGILRKPKDTGSC